MKLTAVNNYVNNHIDKMNGTPPVAVNLTEVTSGSIKGIILLDCAIGKGGTPVEIQQANGVSGLTLDQITQGGIRNDKPIPASGRGDILVFENAKLSGNTLTVGKLATRVHEDMDGKVQVGYLLARPSKSSVSKRGAIQFATLVDPSASITVKTNDSFMEEGMKLLEGEWPGGAFGLVLRRGKEAINITRDDGESVQKFLKRLIDDHDVVENKVLEMIPYWQLPMGNEQVKRDGDVRQERKASVGDFSRLYGRITPEFQPSICILGDEEEWAFNQNTGKKRRVVLGMHPLRTDFGLNFKNLPSLAYNRKPLVPPKWLYKSEADAEKAMQARNDRKSVRKPQVTTSASQTGGTSTPVRKFGF